MEINKLYPNYEKRIKITGIKCDSRFVEPGNLFIAKKGIQFDGNQFIYEAIAKGASFIVSEQELNTSFPHIKVKNARKEEIRLLQLFFNYTNRIYSIGVTGTDGKTTTSHLLYHLFDEPNEMALLGTNGIFFQGKRYVCHRTTLPVNSFYSLYNCLYKKAITHLVMEVSSEGIADMRTYDYSYHGAIFTNLSLEHSNTHKNMNEYFLCKAKLFTSLPKYGLAVINNDDIYGEKLIKMSEGIVVTYGINKGMYNARNISLHLNHTSFDLYYRDIFITTLSTPLLGIYNVYNCLAAIAYAHEYGLSIGSIKRRLLTIQSPEGRFIKDKAAEVNVVVDFAHTPNALTNLLMTIRPMTTKRIILVLGAAGNKDRNKRHLMGTIATNLADIVIFTSEDPKTEEQLQILSDLIDSIKRENYYLTYFRKEALALAASLAKKDDTIVIVGKGMENQEYFKDYTFKHNDLRIIKKHLDNKSECLFS